MHQRRLSARLPTIREDPAAQDPRELWLTPRHLFTPLGPFDLDPCASAEHPDWVPAERRFTVADDGLHQDWEGRVWLNPPYGQVGHWVPRLAEHGSGIALLFVAAETELWQRWVFPHAWAVLFLAGRVTFLRPASEGESGVPEPAKKGHNSGGPSALVAFSWRDAEALANSGLTGALVEAPSMLPAE